METTERLLNEFPQTKYTASIFLDDQVTPVLTSVSGGLRDFLKNTYKVAVSVDMRQVYRAERKKEGDGVKRKMIIFVQQV